MIFQNAQTLQSLNDPILLQDSTSVFLNTDAKISQSIVRYLNILTGNTKNDNFVEIPYTFYKGNELDFFFGFLTNFQGKAFIVMPDLASIEPVIQALDLLNRLCNLHIFHNSQLTCNQVLNDIISERNKNILILRSRVHKHILGSQIIIVGKSLIPTDWVIFTEIQKL